MALLAAGPAGAPQQTDGIPLWKLYRQNLGHLVSPAGGTGSLCAADLLGGGVPVTVVGIENQLAGTGPALGNNPMIPGGPAGLTDGMSQKINLS